MTSASGSEGEPRELKIGRRRVATVFDAVEGTVLPGSFIFNTNVVTEYSFRRQPLTPDEVLFRCNKAPQRYEEYDIYRAHDDLPQGGHGVLPDSDMLRAIHSYVRRFYKSVARGKTMNANERSMDETALLAFGILLEEAVTEIFGENGDLVFTERAGADGDELASRKKGGGKSPEEKGKKGSAIADDADEVVAQSSNDRGVSDVGTGGDEVVAGCHVNTDRKGSKRRWSDESDEDEAQQSVPRIRSTVREVASKRAKKRAKKRHAFC
ncbi:hypothetical protein L249_1429 [Ophiocordyceps polyrhachis-furcata BCC 54312]|uniref:Uncharacterized protein n=1 Tax=Ophiocordyceps polyrhachis-furcata BCC 54312 TaxID=1330021 RepID=A0A367L459_9HYPO|nr:hypothetical protein L249_1429 [Ophiocordyceps polyrhachis-furcata BCC 54312]